MEENNNNVLTNKTGTYKYCFVPECKNRNINNPAKIFISVPKGSERKKWIKITRRARETSLKSSLFCCEDHFKVEEDIENYTRVKLDPGVRIFLKKGVLPRFFSCQKDRKRAFPDVTRPGAKKLKKIRILEDIEQEQNQQSNNDNANNDNELSTITGNENYRQLPALPVNDTNSATEPVGDRNLSFELPSKTVKDVGVQVCIKIKSHYRSTGIAIFMKTTQKGKM
ncbi:uncharacterized protein LOC127278544 [Leptopilina boulardi]|uniref:uncharacterized protein LOC127278544 n=1 Tax=Leptopilina boulardi TaxID=63433 RepID=UPI0021F660AF|nr:uncharacterized protein LOC127278544 [Leptopilina boulardi]